MNTVPSPIIEFRVAGIEPTHHLFDFVSRLLAEAEKNLGMTTKDIRKLVVADDQSYGPAIRELDSSAGYTDDGIYLGVGKIIRECINGSYVGSNLVIHHSLLSSFMAEPSPELSLGQIEAFRYSFFHEMGHCVDHRRRGVLPTPATPMTKSVLLRCAAANSAVVFEEYAACFFSAGYMTDPGFAYMAESTRENLANYLGACAAKRDRYQLGFETLDSVRDAALTAFWRGLIEYAKLAAFLHGNPALDSGMPSWPDGSSESTGVLQAFVNGLPAAWSRYPSCEKEFEQLSIDAWVALTEAEGYAAACYAKLPFALPLAEAQKQLAERATNLGPALLKQKLEEPVAAKRRIK